MEEIREGNQMTALRFQTGMLHQTSPASLPGEFWSSLNHKVCVFVWNGRGWGGGGGGGGGIRSLLESEFKPAISCSWVQQKGSLWCFGSSTFLPDVVKSRTRQEWWKCSHCLFSASPPPNVCVLFNFTKARCKKIYACCFTVSGKKTKINTHQKLKLKPTTTKTWKTVLTSAVFWCWWGLPFFPLPGRRKRGVSYLKCHYSTHARLSNLK